MSLAIQPEETTEQWATRSLFSPGEIDAISPERLPDAIASQRGECSTRPSRTTYRFANSTTSYARRRCHDQRATRRLVAIVGS